MGESTKFSALERMTKLMKVTTALSRTMAPDQVADVVMTLGLDAAGAREGALFCVDAETRDGVLAECFGGRRFPDVRVPPDSDAPVAVCAKTGLFVRESASRVCLPLLVHGHAIGALALELDPGEPAGAYEREFLETMADQCAQALERARLHAIEKLRREELERSNRMKDDFLGIVSHELRTPLSAILGWARMLRDGMLETPSARDRALDAIERNAVLQARLVDDLLDVSRIVSGKLALEIANVDVGSVIDAAIDSVRPTLLTKGLEIATTLPPEGLVVSGDSRRLQQALWNVLTNAVKFTPPGGRIDVCVEHCDKAVTIAVRDTGSGIPADVLPHVFDRFRQADSTTTRTNSGLGLGLSIVRHVVEAHGGGVLARSDGEGRGAEIVVELPLSACEGAPSSAGEGNETACAHLGGTRVLLVDDDVDTRDLLKTALEAAGASVCAVADAREAFSAVKNEGPDVIVSDIAMPGEDGYDFMKKVRALPPDFGGQTPALALSALAQPADRARALAVGYQAHVAKPVDPRDLVRAVKGIMVRI
ncbi:MAG: ATP-binding protein [Polyangiaceae bacterium]